MSGQREPCTKTHFTMQVNSTVETGTETNTDTQTETDLQVTSSGGWRNRQEYKGWKGIAWQSPSDYSRWKHATFHFDTSDDSIHDWWRRGSLAPEILKLHACVKCATDLAKYTRQSHLQKPNHKQGTMVIDFNFECSSESCFWYEWFERRRPLGWDAAVAKYKLKQRTCSGKK
jgi:hypothetical protein